MVCMADIACHISVFILVAIFSGKPQLAGPCHFLSPLVLEAELFRITDAGFISRSDILPVTQPIVRNTDPIWRHGLILSSSTTDRRNFSYYTLAVCS